MKRPFKRLLLIIAWPILILGLFGIVAVMTDSNFAQTAGMLDNIIPGISGAVTNVMRSRYVLAVIGLVGVAWGNTK